MTLATQLAKECGFLELSTEFVRYYTYITPDKLETFYARAQAQALREFKENVRGLLRDPINNIIGYAACSVIQKELDRMADELERKA